MRKELRPHQLKAIEKLSNGKILCGDVGVGKTLTSLGYYVKNESPKDIYVITTAKKRDDLDWDEDAAALGIGKYEGGTIHGLLHVDSWNNIQKYIGVKDAFFIFDEQRLVGSGAWVRAFYKIARANNWILLSATPGDTWLDYIPTFVANGFYKNRTEFIAHHVIYTYYQKFPKVDRYIGVNQLVKYRNQLLVDMPFPRTTVRHIHNVKVDYDQTLFDKVVKKRWHVYEERPLRDISEMFSVARKVVNSDTSRLRQVRALLKTHPKLIVFYNFDYELEALRSLAGKTSRNEDTCGGSTTQSCTTQKLRTTPSTSPSLALSIAADSDGATSSGYWMEDLQTLSQSIPTAAVATSDKSPVTSAKLLDAPASDPIPNISATSGDDGYWMEDLGNGELFIPNSPSEVSKSSDSSPVSRMSTVGPPSDSTFAVSEWNGHKHEPIPDTDSWLYLVQYRAGAEGWNCVETDAICFYSQQYAYRIFYQCQGRIDRLNTPFVDLHYYALRSESAMDKAIGKALDGKQDFNEAAFFIK